MAGESKITSDHKIIRKWIEDRGGVPARVKGTGSGVDPGLLRIEFQDNKKQTSLLEKISWEEFFEKFDEKNLSLLYQDNTGAGKESRFFKFISRKK